MSNQSSDGGRHRRRILRRTGHDDEILPFTGLLDSAALMELVAWYEQHFGLTLKQEEINIDNFGSIRAMTEFGSR